MKTNQNRLAWLSNIIKAYQEAKALLEEQKLEQQKSSIDGDGLQQNPTGVRAATEFKPVEGLSADSSKASSASKTDYTAKSAATKKTPPTTKTAPTINPLQSTKPAQTMKLAPTTKTLLSTKPALTTKPALKTKPISSTKPGSSTIPSLSAKSFPRKNRGADAPAQNYSSLLMEMRETKQKLERLESIHEKLQEMHTQFEDQLKGISNKLETKKSDAGMPELGQKSPKHFF